MSQFPITSDQGLYEAVNYLASGPAGLGQNFNGFSAYQPAYIVGNFKEPFTVSTTATTNPPTWYISDKAISAVTPLNVVDGKTRNIEWTFATPYAQPPFQVGQNVLGTGFSPSFFNGDDGKVLTCSTTSVITQFDSLYVVPSVSSLGSLYFDNSDTLSSTDASARVTVNGPTEQVFISSQCQWYSEVTCSTTTQFDLVVQINRYGGSVDTVGYGAVDYLFDFQETVSQIIHRNTISTSTDTTVVIDAGPNIFTTVLDQPSYGYYWYICEVDFVTKPEYRYDSQGQLVTGACWNANFTGTGANLGSTSTYNSVSLVNVSSGGSGGLADVEIQPNQTNYAQSASVSIYGGTDYAVGDTVKILGTDIGGASPANDMLLTITQVKYPGNATPNIQTIGLRSLTAQVIKQ